MSDRARLADLEEILDLLYERLGAFQKALVIREGDAAIFELRQRIKREILPDIRRYEREYWEIFSTEPIVISEEEAVVQLVKVEQAVESIERIPSSEYPPELLLLLQEIRAKLDDLDRSASAKLKVSLPLIPMIASYELEMDTEGVMYKTWKSIARFFGR